MRAVEGSRVLSDLEVRCEGVLVLTTFLSIENFMLVI